MQTHYAHGDVTKQSIEQGSRAYQMINQYMLQQCLSSSCLILHSMRIPSHTIVLFTPCDNHLATIIQASATAQHNYCNECWVVLLLEKLNIAASAELWGPPASLKERIRSINLPFRNCWPLFICTGCLCTSELRWQSQVAFKALRLQSYR